MSNSDLTSILFLLLLLGGSAQLLGWLFERLRQPKVVGEILAGFLWGPDLIGRLPYATRLTEFTSREGNVLSFVYWFGLLLLLFLSGAETSKVFRREDRKEVAWLTIVGTGLPFVLALMLSAWLLHPAMAGPTANRVSLTLIFAAAVAVTSVPVVSKIFADLKILHTRFARLVLSVAILEDIVLWLALALATAVAGNTRLSPGRLAYHLVATMFFFGLGLTLVPRLLKRLFVSLNIVAPHSMVALALAVLLSYCVIAGALDVSLVIAAFLAGIAFSDNADRTISDALDAIRKVSFAIFIPLYFAIVGMKLDLRRGFSLWMVLLFLAGSSAVKILSISLAGRFAGFRGLDLMNLAITANARGGPGIVLASVAYEAGIISPKFYTALILAAVLTSQMAGAWLDYILHRGWPLLNSASAADPATIAGPENSVAV